MKIQYLFVLSFVFLSSCLKDKGKVDYNSDFPDEVAAVILTKCAIAGCHNTLSKNAAAGLSLADWGSLFEGSRGGAAVIPYRPDYSTLCFFTNSYTDLGLVSSPQMPIGLKPLTRGEYLSLQNWILQGAPNKRGEIKFSNAANKLYITNQLCNLVSVVDGESGLVMRFVDVGAGSKTDFPVCVKVSPDKKYWYVCFLASHLLQKFETATDKFVAQVDLGEGVWNSFDINAGSDLAFCADKSSAGKVVTVNLNEMKVVTTYTNQNFKYPEATVFNSKMNKLYLGAEQGNFISVIDLNNEANPDVSQLILDGSSSLNFSTSNDPNYLLLDESLNLCFVACRNSKEVKIIDMATNAIISSIYLGESPAQMDYAKDSRMLFVTCTDDSTSFPGNTGSVKVIFLQSKRVIKTINTGYQPNGICVNKEYGYVAVVNSNISPRGPRPHHTGGCAGRNGYLSFIDLGTLELLADKKYELAVYPYAIALR